MATRISSELIQQIAQYHDARPHDYRRFAGENGVILSTREGGRVVDLRGEVLSLECRITNVVDTLECTGITEAKLVIGDGSRYVIVYES